MGKVAGAIGKKMKAKKGTYNGGQSGLGPKGKIGMKAAAPAAPAPAPRRLQRRMPNRYMQP